MNMEFPRKATQKNVEDFNLKNPNIKEMIDKVINNYFMTDDLIIDKEGLPYDKIIKDFVRNYEIVSESDILKSLMDFTENKKYLRYLNIQNKNDYYISKLKTVCAEIITDLHNDNINEIKLSDRIELCDDLYKAIVNFVGNEIIAWQKRYTSIPKYAKVLDENRTILLGRFFRTFIYKDFGKVSYNKEQQEIINNYNQTHERFEAHCYAFAENSDVLFTKEEHDFSFSTMKYDFEDGYSEDLNTSNQKSYTYTTNKKSKNTGCILLIISLGILLGTIISLSF